MDRSSSSVRVAVNTERALADTQVSWSLPIPSCFWPPTSPPPMPTPPLLSLRSTSRGSRCFHTSSTLLRSSSSCRLPAQTSMSILEQRTHSPWCVATCRARADTRTVTCPRSSPSRTSVGHLTWLSVPPCAFRCSRSLRPLHRHTPPSNTLSPV